MLRHSFPDSTNLAEIEYNPAELLLDVRFKSGKAYRYSSVPEEIVRQLLISPSAGKFFGRYIAKSYSYTQIS